MAGYETYVHIYNDSSEDFTVNVGDATSGYWDPSLPSHVAAGEDVKGTVKDRSGVDTGSAGSFKIINSTGYEAKATFACPYGAFSNKGTWSEEENPGNQCYVLSLKSKTSSDGDWEPSVDPDGSPLWIHFHIKDCSTLEDSSYTKDSSIPKEC